MRGPQFSAPFTPGSCGGERLAMSLMTGAHQENGNQCSNARAPRWRVGTEALGRSHCG